MTHMNKGLQFYIVEVNKYIWWSLSMDNIMSWLFDCVCVEEGKGEEGSKASRSSSLKLVQIKELFLFCFFSLLKKDIHGRGQ